MTLLLTFSLLYYVQQIDSMLLCLFSNRSQNMSKCGENISDTLTSKWLTCHILCSNHILTSSSFDLLPNRCTATWNLFVNSSALSKINALSIKFINNDIMKWRWWQTVSKDCNSNNYYSYVVMTSKGHYSNISFFLFTYKYIN